MAGRIEFLGADDGATGSGPPGDGPPEDHLPEPPPPAHRRRTILIFALIGVVVVGLLVARAVTSGGRHEAAKPTPESSAPTGPVSSSQIDVTPGALSLVLASPAGQALAAYCAGAAGLPGATDGAGPQALPMGGTYNEQGADAACKQDFSECPEATDGQSACSSTTTVPADVLAAVRMHYPDARLALTLTETIRENGNFWYRELLFALPNNAALRIDIVQRPSTVPESGERQDSSGLFTRVVHSYANLVVLVSTSQVSSKEPDLSVLGALAADPGLFTVN